METTQKLNWYKKLVIALTISTIVPTTLLLMSLSPSAPSPSASSVSQEEARTLILKYRQSAAAAETPVNAIRIEAGQLEAINNIATANPNAKGYRMYYGEDAEGAAVSVVVGVNDDGQDMTENIYSTARKGSNLCPPVCDVTSPLTN
ncbi:MAG: hypothetical protein IPO24_18860 [Bacteroidetes bacterium]|nr:hypothetical protein [Bacteroidota bacterium]